MINHTNSNKKIMETILINIRRKNIKNNHESSKVVLIWQKHLLKYRKRASKGP